MHLKRTLMVQHLHSTQRKSETQITGKLLKNPQLVNSRTVNQTWVIDTRVSETKIQVIPRILMMCLSNLEATSIVPQNSCTLARMLHSRAMWEKLGPVAADSPNPMSSAHTTASFDVSTGVSRSAFYSTAPVCKKHCCFAMKSLEMLVICSSFSICNAFLIKPVSMTTWGLSLSSKSKEGPVCE